MDDLLRYAETLALLVAVCIFFVAWRSEAKRSAQEQEGRDKAAKERDQALLKAVSALADLIRDTSAKQSTEHANMLKLAERIQDSQGRVVQALDDLNRDTLTEHRHLTEALKELTTLMKTHMDDERAKR